MKKVMALVLVVLMFVMVFSGCGSQNNDQDSNNNQNKKENNVSEKDNVANDENEKNDSKNENESDDSNDEEVIEELPVLKMLRSYSKDDLNKYPTYETIKEVTGYEVEFDTLPAEEPITKLNLIMATGGGYDLVTIPSPTNNYYEYATNGALLGIKDVLEEYGQNIIKGLGGEKFMNPLVIDDELYCIPQPNPGAYLDKGLFVRTDWLEEIDMEIPKTNDEFVEVLKAFKTNKPDGQEFVIPYVNGPELFSDVFAGAFGVSTRYVVEDGKLISRYNSKSMIDYLEFMNMLFEESLIDNEFPVNTPEVINEKIFSGKSGLFTYLVWGADGFVNTFSENLPEASYEAIGYPVGPDGKSGVYTGQGYYSFNAIPQSSKNAEHVIKFWNKVYEEDNFIKVYLGYEGEHWEYNDKNEITPIQPKFGDERSNGGFIIGIGEDYQLKYWTPRLQKNANLYQWFNELQKFSDVRNFDSTDLAPAFESVLGSRAECDEIAKEYITKFISGDLPIDEYQTFLDKYNKAGGQAAEADLAKWYADNN